MDGHDFELGFWGFAGNMMKANFGDSKLVRSIDAE